MPRRSIIVLLYWSLPVGALGMGYHWKVLGYATLQVFINAMYKDEASQLDAMCRYIQVNGLVNALKNKDWKAFARGYNGGAYAKNNYDVKLANAYKEALK